MNDQEYLQLLAEKSALDKMIENLPKSCIIDRLSLEARRKKVVKHIGKLTEDISEKKYLIV